MAWKTDPIVIPAAKKIMLIFHGPFVFHSGPRGVDVIVPTIEDHVFCWGEMPIGKHEPGAGVPPVEDVRSRIPAPNGKMIDLSAFVKGGTRKGFDRGWSIPLPRITPKEDALECILHLPWPKAIFPARSRKLGNETVTITGPNGVSDTITGDFQSSRVQVLEYEGADPGAIGSKVVHFHLEELSFNLQVPPPDHTFRAFERAFIGLEIAASSSVHVKSPFPAPNFLGLEKAHWRSLHELDGGMNHVNCDGGSSNC